jgi:hypothetical protein
LDGRVDAVDASTVLSEYSNLSTGRESIFNELQTKLADFNGDDSVNAVDASNILSHYAENSVDHK